MKSLSHIFLIIIFASSSYSFSSEDNKSFQEQSMLSVLYVQTSTEFAANNIQTYANATKALEIALQDKKWTAALEQEESFKDKPPAIIIDVDETVLDNSPFQSRTILSGLSYPNGWSEWVNESNADAVEGVYDFLNFANNNNVEIFYLTNRLESYRDATKKNLINDRVSRPRIRKELKHSKRSLSELRLQETCRASLRTEMHGSRTSNDS